MSATKERHSMSGWGKRIADFDEPRTMEEAAFTAQMLASDRLMEIQTLLVNLERRMFRLESWLETSMPGYRQSPAYRAEPGDNPNPGTAAQIYAQAIRGVRIS